jgi:cell shape-determining protein MreD
MLVKKLHQRWHDFSIFMSALTVVVLLAVVAIATVVLLFSLERVLP